MELVSSGQRFSFNYTDPYQRSNLNVEFKIYDVTSGSTLVSTVVGAYTNFGSYMGSFIPAANKIYLVIGLVYTDNTFTVVDTTAAQTSNVYQVIPSSGIVTLFGFSYATYDYITTLSIRASVYNVTSGTPTLSGTATLTHIANGVYYGSFSGANASTYSVLSVVYTDGTFTNPNTAYAPGSNEFDSLNVSGGNGPVSTDWLCGIVPDTNPLIFCVQDTANLFCLVNDSNLLIGTVEV